MGIHENLIQSFTNFKNKFIGNIGNSTIAELLSDKVSKSGDTITGNLIQASGLFQQKYNGDVKIQLSSNNEGGNILLYPPNSITTTGHWEFDAYNGNLRLFYIDGNSVKASFTIPKEAGSIDINNLLKTTGGTMTGALTLPQLTFSRYVNGTAARQLHFLISSNNNNFYIDDHVNGTYVGSPLIIEATSRTIWTTYDTHIYGVLRTKNGIANDAGWQDWYNGNTNRGSIYCNYNGNDFTVRANVNGGSLHLNCANNVRLESDNGTLVVNRAGNWTNIAANAFNVQSSRKVKKNIKAITNEEAEKILDIDVVSFDYIEQVGGIKNRYGVIAEEVEKIYPSVVTIPKGYDEDSDDYMNVPSIDYSKFVPFLIKMIQMQQKQIDELKKRVEVLESKI